MSRARILDLGAPPLFVFLWSTGFISAKLGLPYIEPMTFLALRFLATSIGNFLSGWLARTFGRESVDGGLAVFFRDQAWFVFGATAVLLLLVPAVKRLMGGVR